MRALRELIFVEFKLFFREPIAVFFTILFPFIPLLLFGTIFGKQPAMPGFRVIDLYVPALMAMVVGYLGLMGIPIAISEYREQGVLKRYSVSPMSPGKFVFAHVIVQFTLLAAVSVLIAAVAELVFDIRFAGSLALFALGIIISSVSLFTLGFLVVKICRTTRTTQAVGSTIFFIMLFLSGAAIPRILFPEWLQQVTNYVPLTHVVNTLTGLWVGQSLNEQLASVIVLLGITVAAYLLIRQNFGWRES
jgi:ABC-2 type transport system permease protein